MSLFVNWPDSSLVLLRVLRWISWVGVDLSEEFDADETKGKHKEECEGDEKCIGDGEEDEDAKYGDITRA